MRQENEKKPGLITLDGEIIAERLYDHYQSTEKQFTLRHDTKMAIIDLEGSLIHGELALTSTTRPADPAGKSSIKLSTSILFF